MPSRKTTFLMQKTRGTVEEPRGNGFPTYAHQQRPSPPPTPASLGQRRARPTTKPRTPHSRSGPPAGPASRTPTPPRPFPPRLHSLRLTWARRSHLTRSLSETVFKTRAKTPERRNGRADVTCRRGRGAPAQTARSPARKVALAVTPEGRRLEMTAGDSGPVVDWWVSVPPRGWYGNPSFRVLNVELGSGGPA